MDFFGIGRLFLEEISFSSGVLNRFNGYNLATSTNSQRAMQIRREIRNHSLMVVAKEKC